MDWPLRDTAKRFMSEWLYYRSRVSLVISIYNFLIAMIKLKHTSKYNDHPYIFLYPGR
jgi:hypothetical protein